MGERQLAAAEVDQVCEEAWPAHFLPRLTGCKIGAKLAAYLDAIRTIPSAPGPGVTRLAQNLDNLRQTS